MVINILYNKHKRLLVLLQIHCRWIGKAGTQRGISNLPIWHRKAEKLLYSISKLRLKYTLWRWVMWALDNGDINNFLIHLIYRVVSIIRIGFKTPCVYWRRLPLEWKTSFNFLLLYTVSANSFQTFHLYVESTQSKSYRYNDFVNKAGMPQPYLKYNIGVCGD